MTTAQIALSVIMIIASLFLIVVVLLQEGAQQGLGVGGQRAATQQTKREQRGGQLGFHGSAPPFAYTQLA